jgi:hypothetical protein
MMVSLPCVFLAGGGTVVGVDRYDVALFEVFELARELRPLEGRVG